MKRVLATVANGGSAVLCGPFGREFIGTAERYPAELFSQLDTDWQECAQRLDEYGVDLLVPPVLGIVLTRSARREAIPAVIADLRNEWADGRTKIWNLTEGLRAARNVKEALEIQKEIEDASRLFSPRETELDTRPIRILWEILGAAAAGAVITSLAGGNIAVTATTTAIAQAARTVPGALQDLGAAIFGLGAFDLARRVRRAVSQVEVDALSKLLSDGEKQKLGIR